MSSADQDLSQSHHPDVTQDQGQNQDQNQNQNPDQAPAHTRRRTLITRTAALTVTALVVGATALALSAPGADPDPLAIFDRGETESDQGWAELLTQDYVATITLGPRTVDLGNDRVAIAFRSAAVADGRSTEYDPYCLVTSDTSGSALGGQCVTPERFASEGIVLPIAPSASGDGFDTAIWGPTGLPQLETDRSLEPLTAASTVLDSMAFSSVIEVGVDPLAIVSKPDWLLMGPVQVPTYYESNSESNPELLSDLSNNAGTTPPNIVTSTYLLRGESTATSAVFCAHAAVSGGEATTMCVPLSAVRRQGFEFTVIVDAREWSVSIAADGPARRNTLRLAD